MVEANGIDLGSIYGLLREVAAVVNRHDQRFDSIDRRYETIEARLQRIEAGMVTKAELKAATDELRQEIREYHAAVVGRGIHLSEHDERIARLEQHAGFGR